MLMLMMMYRSAIADVYIIYYATKDGKTGHVGIAVDNYRIIFRQVETGGKFIEKEDTVATGELTYYDLWPRDDEFGVTATLKDIPAAYYKLPASSMEEITVNSLYDKGIPHKEHYPCDGILKIKTNWEENNMLRGYLDSLIEANRAFNARSFNCADFVKGSLEYLKGIRIDATEFIFPGRSSTPNALYRELRKMPFVEVIKNADEAANGSFLKERILYGRKEGEL
jgi:hypothetical protein